MKSLAIAFVLIVWLIVTAIAAVTILGLTLIVSANENNPTTWMKIGQRLAEHLITYSPSKNS